MGMETFYSSHSDFEGRDIEGDTEYSNSNNPNNDDEEDRKYKDNKRDFDFEINDKENLKKKSPKGEPKRTQVRISDNPPIYVELQQDDDDNDPYSNKLSRKERELREEAKRELEYIEFEERKNKYRENKEEKDKYKKYDKFIEKSEGENKL